MSEDDRVAETHSAWVVLLGDHAYKVKKPVKLDFLDFSTRDARERAVHREVELNRRLAPDVYEGVADVLGSDGTPCEHIIVMQRMPDDRRLATLVADNQPLDDEIRAIARAVTAFHERARTSPEIAQVGSPKTVRAKIEVDLEQMHGFVPDVLDAEPLDEVSSRVRQFLRGRTRLFERRVADGSIRDGHGDLLAEDIFCLPDGPRILDCIDFDDQLRYGDVLADLAFLAMDLERLGSPRLAAQLVADYREFSGAQSPVNLLHFYVAARALIRAKVACIRVTQGGGGDARTDARDLVELARRHLRRGTVRLVLVGGPPGTGKSTLATAMADRLDWVTFHSDEIRKDLAGIGHTTSAGAPIDQGIYDAPTSERTYDQLLDQARSVLELGECVILDASWSASAHRDAAARVAAATSSQLVEIRCDAPARIADHRIAERGRAGNQPSDATPEVADAMRAGFEDWPSAHVVHTDDSLDRSVAAALPMVGAD